MGEQHLDFLGRPIREGDTVVWGIGAHPAYGLRKGTVTDLVTAPASLVRVKGDGCPGGWRCPFQVCVVDPVTALRR